MHTVFISIFPRFTSPGHMPSMSLGMQRLAETFNWQFFNLIPKSYTDKKSSKWLNTLMPKEDFYLSLRKSLSVLFNMFEKSRKIIYIDSFHDIHLKGLISSLGFLNKKNIYLIIIQHTLKLSLGHKKYHEECVNLLENDHVFFFCDSQEVMESWICFFRYPVTLVPCAHLICDDLKPINREKTGDKLVVWWPGAVREEKGLTHIQALSKTTKQMASKLTLVAGFSSNLRSHPKGPKIKLIDDNLEREEYLNWLYRSDIIVLPYDAKRYETANSGIFIEGIIAEKLVLAIDNTWMSLQLKKYSLSELILDPKDPWDTKKMIELCQNKDIFQKIKKMSLDYRSFHSLSKFQDIFQKLKL